MRTVLVTGSDTGVGKTHVVSVLARLLSAGDRRVQIVKPVESGRSSADPGGDAARAAQYSGAAEAHTLLTFAAPLSPPAAAQAEGRMIDFSQLLSSVRSLPAADWRIVEGAGGIASPIDHKGRDWADFALDLGCDCVVLVIANRLGAINQARLAMCRAREIDFPCGVWLNACSPDEPTVAVSNRQGLAECGVSVWAETGFASHEPVNAQPLLSALASIGISDCNSPLSAVTPGDRCRLALAERDARGLRRRLRVAADRSSVLNLADNDYLDLARDPAVLAGAAAAGAAHGTSASASPLISGWLPSHEALVAELCAWHGFNCGLLWSSGHAANTAVFGTLPASGDTVFADKLIHQSMHAGIAHSGAKLRRHEHLRLDRLEEMLQRYPVSGGATFVATESVFSMDGDRPDLARLAELKRRYGFFLVLDEAHALGWYGPQGAGLACAAGIAKDVDVFVGTFGKGLASGGAYTLFNDAAVRDHLANFAGEFVFSTSVSPLLVGAAAAAIGRVRQLAVDQPKWHALSRQFRKRLQAAGWAVADGDAPIVPVELGMPQAAVGLAEALREDGIIVGAVRPPTVPAGTSRLRISLKSTLTESALDRVIAVMDKWRRNA
jgi:8-amino-7-oxononanoate synthase